MAAPTPPVGYSAAELDAIFATLFTEANANRASYMQTRTPPELQPYLNYYYGVSPPGVVTPSYANVIATGVIKGTPGTCIRVMVVTPGTGSNFTMNNCATVGAATAGNKIIDYQAFPNGLYAGQIIEVNFTANVGIVVSSIPTGGQFTIVYT